MLAHAKAILEKLQRGPVQAFDQRPARSAPSARTVPAEKSKLQALNAEMPAAEKAERIKKIDEALDRLSL